MLRLFLIDERDNESEEENIFIRTTVNVPHIAEEFASTSNSTRNIVPTTNSVIPNITEQSTNTSGELSKNRIELVANPSKNWQVE